MQYQVLARKWRPQTFHDVVGQEHVSRTLLNALQSGRVAHAFLFSGPRGCGKTTMARILAKALNCRVGKLGEPCGICPACTEIVAGNAIDVLEIDAASKTSVDDVRQLIEQSRYNPARDRHKIFIIDEVHMLSNSAFAALLKTLEEPPAHVVFIMATTEYHKIPATILSRCQQYSFKLIPYPLILSRLSEISKAEDIQISHSALEQVVFSSGGSMRDAMSALDQVIAFSGNHVGDDDVTKLLGLVAPRVLSQTVRAIAATDLPVLLKTVADLVESGQDLTNFCRRLSGQFRNLMVLKAGIADPALLGIPESMLPELREQSELFSREDLLRLFDAFQKIEAGMKYATQVRFQMEMGLIELAQIARLRPLEELVSEFSALAGGETNPPAGNTPGGAGPGSFRTPRKAPEPPTQTLSTSAPPAPARMERVGLNAPVHPPTTEPVLPDLSSDSRELLSRIAAGMERESLESCLLGFAGARAEGARIILEPGQTSEFARRLIRDNLSGIAQVASRVMGSAVKVEIGEPEKKNPPKQELVKRTTPSEETLLEKVKKEPVVRSFLDVFPGPVKAEKIDS
jgi:DNA polymerase III subunit gamma/tau